MGVSLEVVEYPVHNDVTLWRGPHVYKFDDTRRPNINGNPPCFATLVVASSYGRSASVLQYAPHAQFQLQTV